MFLRADAILDQLRSFRSEALSVDPASGPPYALPRAVDIDRVERMTKERVSIRRSALSPEALRKATVLWSFVPEDDFVRMQRIAGQDIENPMGDVMSSMTALANPPERWLSSRTPSYAMEFLRAAIPEERDIQWLAPATWTEFREALERVRPQLLLLSGLNINTRALIEMAAMGREAGVKEVWLGNYAAAGPYKLLDEVFDRLFWGAGERWLCEALYGGPPRQAHPPASRMIGEAEWLAATPDGGLGRVRFPVLHFAIRLGCTQRCSYCAESKFSAGSRISTAVDQILALLRDAHAQGLRRAYVIDPDFGRTWQPEVEGRVVDTLGELGFRWSCLTSVPVLDRRGPFLMERGLRSAYVGIETLASSGGKPDDGARVRTEMGRPWQHRTEEVIGRLTQAGLLVFGLYMLGNPGESLETALRGVERLRSLVPLAQISTHQPFPGTAEFLDAARRGHVFQFDPDGTHYGRITWAASGTPPDIDAWEALYLHAHRLVNELDRPGGFLERQRAARQAAPTEVIMPTVKRTLYLIGPKSAWNDLQAVYARLAVELPQEKWEIRLPVGEPGAGVALGYNSSDCATGDFRPGDLVIAAFIEAMGSGHAGGETDIDRGLSDASVTVNELRAALRANNGYQRPAAYVFARKDGDSSSGRAPLQHVLGQLRINAPIPYETAADLADQVSKKILTHLERYPDAPREPDGLVGRKALLERAETWRFSSGGGRVLVFEGLPGVGKTALANEVLHAFATGGHVGRPAIGVPAPAPPVRHCLTHKAMPEDTGIPYRATLALIKEIFHAADLTTKDTDPGDLWARLYAQLKGVLGDGTEILAHEDADLRAARAFLHHIGDFSELPPPSDEEVTTLHGLHDRGMEWLAREFARTEAVLLVDDVQWLDSKSQTFLGLLTGGASHVRVVATRRPSNVTTMPFADETNITVPPLDGSVDQLLDAILSALWRDPFRLAPEDREVVKRLASKHPENGGANNPANLEYVVGVRAWVGDKDKHGSSFRHLESATALGNVLTTTDHRHISTCALVEGWFEPRLLTSEPRDGRWASFASEIAPDKLETNSSDAQEWMVKMVEHQLFVRHLDNDKLFRFRHDLYRERFRPQPGSVEPTIVRLAAAGLLSKAVHLEPDVAAFRAAGLLREFRLTEVPVNRLFRQIARNALARGRVLAEVAAEEGASQVNSSIESEVEAALDCLALQFEAKARAHGDSLAKDFKAKFNRLVPRNEQLPHHRVLQHKTLAYLFEKTDNLSEALKEALEARRALQDMRATDAPKDVQDRHELAVAKVLGLILSKQGQLMAWPDGPRTPEGSDDSTYAIDALDRFRELRYTLGTSADTLRKEGIGAGESHAEISALDNHLGWVLWRSGLRMKAQEAHHHALRRAQLARSALGPKVAVGGRQTSGDLRRQAWARIGLGHTLIDSQGHTGAGLLARDILAASKVTQEMESIEPRIAYNLLYLAGCLYLRYGNDPVQACVFFQRAYKLLDNMGIEWESLYARYREHEANLERHYREVARPASDQQIPDPTLPWPTPPPTWEREVEATRDRISDTLKRAQSLGAQREIGIILRLRARAARLVGDFASAAGDIQSAQATLRKAGDRYEWSLAVLEAARIAWRRDDRALPAAMESELLTCAYFLIGNRWRRALDDLRFEFLERIGSLSLRRAVDAYTAMEFGRQERWKQNREGEGELVRQWNANLPSLLRLCKDSVSKNDPLQRLAAPSRHEALGPLFRGPI